MASGFSDLDGEVTGQLDLPAPEWIDIDTTVNDEIILEFQRTDSTNQGDITIYRSQTDGTLGSAIATVPYDATSYTDTTANVDEVNYYTLRRDTGDSTADSIQANTLLPPPGITPNATKWDAHLVWSDAATTEVGYRVYRQPQGGSETLVADLPADSTEYQTDRLTIIDSDQDTWTYRVEAYRPGLSSGEETTASEATTFTLPGITFQGDWTVIRPNASDSDGEPYIEDAAWDVDPVMDTANPFGDYAVAKLDDSGGEKFDLYPRGERVEFWRAGNRSPRLTGYVVERRETEQSGADALEVEAYSFDQFLRRNTVTNAQDGKQITAALEDIIKTDTPVSWNPGNINVGDEQELTRDYRGEKVENVLRDLAFKSNNEEFGVNDQLEFFFRPRETQHIDRGIDNTQWFNYDIPELGKQAINEVEVWFAGGDESVIVDDGTDKLDLQDSLGLEDPGTQRAELNRPLIQDISDAEDIGRKYLQFRNSTLSGTITTYGLYDAEPGDTIDITIRPRGIDDEFVIAATEYRWGRDQTIFTIVEKRGEQDGILTELNDSVQRVEMNGANRDAPKNRITSTDAAANIDVTVDADGQTPSGVKFVNDGRRSVRDGWTNEPNPAIQNIVVGDDPSGLSRSNTSLGNQTNSAAVSESLPDSKSVEYSASVTETGVEEIGLTTTDGTLIARAVFDSPVDLAGTVTITLTVSNDDSISRGVLTNDGQTAVRDVLADNNPLVPTHYAYGSDGSAVEESQTSLGQELYTTSLDELLVQDANTQSEWEQITAEQPEYPLGADANDTYGLFQVCWTTEAFDDSDGSYGTNSNPNYSDGLGIQISVNGSFAEYEFTPSHTIPTSAFSAQYRVDTPTADGSAEVDVYLERPNGTRRVLDTIPAGFTSNGPSWVDDTLNDQTEYEGDELVAGETYTLGFEFVSAPNDEALVIDVVAPYDDRFEGDLTFSTDNGGNGGYLNGPEFYPAQEVASTSAGTRRNVSEASFVSAWNDTSESQYVEIAVDGQNYTRFDNTSSGSVAFGQLESGLDVNWSFSRYSDGSQMTPLEGNQGQRMSSWELYSNPDAVVTDDIAQTVTRAIVPPNTTEVLGETIREAGLKNGSTLLSRHELAEFVVDSDQRLASSESTRFRGDNS